MNAELRQRIVTKLRTLMRPATVAAISIFIVGTLAFAGSLSPSASPIGTMNTLADIYAAITGTFNSAPISANQNGSLIQVLKYINSQLSWASSSNDVYLLSSGNVGIGTTTPDAKLDIAGTTSDLTANSLQILNASGSPLLIVRNDGVVSIGTTDPGMSSFRVRPITLYGAANLSTSGTATTVTTTGGAFSNVFFATRITANGVSRTVVTKTDNNTVVVDNAVDWDNGGAGYPFTYEKSANMSIDAPNDEVSRVFTFTRGDTTDWTLLVRHDEGGQNFYIRNGPTGRDILTITNSGNVGLNLPTALAGVTPLVPANMAIYPQFFDNVQVFIFGSGYSDITESAMNSEDVAGPYTIAPNTDYLYLGMQRTFDSAFFERVTGPTVGVPQAEYWNGVGWVIIGPLMDFADGTNGLTQTGAVSWDKSTLTGWTTMSVNGSSAYYFVRISFTTYIGGPLSFNMVVPGSGNRFDVYKASLDTSPVFSVNGVGRTGLGSRVTFSRIEDVGADLTDRSALSVIDDRGLARIWAFDPNHAAGLQLVAGTGSVSDDIQWDIHVASVSGPYGTEGLYIEHDNGAGMYNALTLNPLNVAGTSAAGATFAGTLGAMNGNDLMTGLALNYINGAHTGTGNAVHALDIHGITPSPDASESAIFVGSGWDYAFVASVGNVGIGTLTPQMRLEVAGGASVSSLFGAGLSTCTASHQRFQYDAVTGIFGCTIVGIPMRTTGSGFADYGSQSFSESAFDLTPNGIEAIISLDYVNGPASRSLVQIITGHWTFAAGASFSDSLEVLGPLYASSSFFGAGLTTCNTPTDKLTWVGGSFGCGVDQNSGTGTGSSTMEVREFGAAFDSFPATISFDAGKFNLTASDSSDVTISLDWGPGGPASLSQDETVTGQWTFSAAQVGFIVANNASISGALEVSGYASSSKLFGAGLTDCDGTFTFLKWDSSTGLFSCASEAGGVRTESSGTTVVEDNQSLNFDSNGFSLVASGTTETNIALNLASQWTFTGGVSVSTNPFEVGSNAFYADPTAGRVGINTQNLSEALELVGNASVSGNLYTGGNIGIGTTSPQYPLDVRGAGNFGAGTHTQQTLFQFNVGHTLTLLYTPNEFGQAGFDALAVRNVDTEQNLFTVYGSQSVQFIANAQGNTFNSQFIAMNNPEMANLAGATEGLFTNKATTHDIAIQYSYGGAAPIDAILLDVNPAANIINSIIVNNGNQNIPFRVAGLSDVNLLYVDGTSKVGIGTNAPETKLEVVGAASASQFFGAGLTDCDGEGEKLVWTASGSNAGKFSCKTDWGGRSAMFTDSTADNDIAWTVGAQDLWDGTFPNLTVNRAISRILVSVTIMGDDEDGGDMNAVLSLRRAVGTNPTCASTQIDSNFAGTFMTASGMEWSANATLLDTGTFAAGDNVRYTVCTEATGTEDGDVLTITISVLEVGGADLAENYYTADRAIEPGDVVALDSSSPAGIRKTSGAYDRNVIGVVSMEPGMVLDDGMGAVPGRMPRPVALSGRIPVKVSTENGPVKTGDYLTPSSVAGVAMKATKAGPVIGQAMGDLSNVSGTGYVMLFIKNSTFNGEQVDASIPSQNLLATLAGLAPAGTGKTSQVVTDTLIAAQNVIASAVDTHALSVDVVSAGASGSISFVIPDSGQFAIRASGTEGEAPIILNSNGDAFFAGTLKVGTLDADEIIGLADIKAQIASASTLIADVSQRLGNLEQQVALRLDMLASASDAFSVDGPLTLNNGLRVDSIGSVGTAISFLNDTIFFGRPYFNSDTGGFAVIQEGTSEVRVQFGEEYLSQPVVNVTLTAEASDSTGPELFGIQYVVTDKDATGFTIRLSENAPLDVRFSWSAFAITDARTILSATPEPSNGPASSLEPSVSVEPTPEVSVEPSVTPSPNANLEPTPAATPDTTPTPEPTNGSPDEPLPEVSIEPPPNG